MQKNRSAILSIFLLKFSFILANFTFFQFMFCFSTHNKNKKTIFIENEQLIILN